MRIEIDEWASNKREVHRAAKLLSEGGLLAIPTDSGYALACDLHSNSAIDRIYELKQSPRSHPLSMILAEPDDVGRYTSSVSTHAYRVLKRVLPGPYVFILDAGAEIPKRMHKKRKTIGIRVPDADVPRELVRMLGRPIVCSSLRIPGSDEDRWVVDPADIDRAIGERLDAVVDSGPGVENPTTVVDLTVSPFEILREGQGPIDVF